MHVEVVDALVLEVHVLLDMIIILIDFFVAVVELT